jgi:diadenosine tetraphosphatase ApaH/serine/threonine PP2A family protein phosphatase
MNPRAIYAIGDVHGEAERLAVLHSRIAADVMERGERGLILHLGDLVDRGPDSRRAVALAMAVERAPPPNCEAMTILGNHEQMMLAAAADEQNPAPMIQWMTNGGEPALRSYVSVNGEYQDWRHSIDEDHWRWLASLDSMHREGDFVFVHAGIEPAVFPECGDDIRLWTRSKRFFESKKWPKRAELKDILVVHGHTPTKDFAPDVETRRINVDTGAVYGGPLTAVVLKEGEEPRFLAVGGRK